VRRTAMVALAAALAGGLLAACGGDDGESAKAAQVTLTDYELRAPARVRAGRVTFEAQNKGTFVHEIALVKTDLAPDQLPRDDEGLFDERGQGVQFIDEVEDIDPSKTAPLSVDLDPGRYVLLCNKPAEPGDPQSHFQHGMYSQLTVT
jgi:uncharacterized cupredoxin-like copper-binding protein